MFAGFLAGWADADLLTVTILILAGGWAAYVLLLTLWEAWRLKGYEFPSERGLR